MLPTSPSLTRLLPALLLILSVQVFALETISPRASEKVVVSGARIVDVISSHGLSRDPTTSPLSKTIQSSQTVMKRTPDGNGLSEEDKILAARLKLWKIPPSDTEGVRKLVHGLLRDGVPMGAVSGGLIDILPEVGDHIATLKG